MKKMLLHSCCGPCSTAVIEQLIDEYDVVVYYYNPNIYPYEEYLHRLSEQKRFLKEKYGDKISLIEGDWDCKKFRELSLGLEKENEGGSRCKICFQMRLEGVAKYAKENGYDIFTSTLSVSPYKNYLLLNEIGGQLEKKYNIEYLNANFKKNDGYKRSVELSKENNIYRQAYCGCEFALNIQKQEAPESLNKKY